MTDKSGTTWRNDELDTVFKEIYLLSKTYRRSEDQLVREFGEQLFLLVQAPHSGEHAYHALTNHLKKFETALQNYNLRRQTKFN